MTTECLKALHEVFLDTMSTLSPGTSTANAGRLLHENLVDEIVRWYPDVHMPVRVSITGGRGAVVNISWD